MTESTAGLAAADLLVGQVIDLEEPDYAYGIGPLRLRVRRAGPMPDHEDWLSVEGVRVDDEGQEREDHSIGVRLTAVLPYLRPDRPAAVIPAQPEPRG